MKIIKNKKEIINKTFEIYKNKITKNLNIREYELLDSGFNDHLNIRFEGLKIYMKEQFA